MGLTNKWGGARKGAGRPKAEATKKTAEVRVDDSLLPAIKILKQRHKDGQEIETLIPVTSNQDELLAQLEQYKQANTNLVLKYDNEHLRAVKLVSKVQYTLQSTLRGLRGQLEELKHLEHNCQALKKDGSRCTRPAKLKTDYNGIEIHVCLQHSKALAKKQPRMY